MTKRKYITELGLSFFSDGVAMVHPTNIKEIDNISEEMTEITNKCHIYLIVTRPKITFVPDSINISNGYTRGKFQYSKKGKNIQTGFKLKGEATADKIEISAFPHNEIRFINDGKIFRSAPAHLISSLCHEIDDQSLLELKVVYVGMSYADGKSSAKQRLKSHSTLQDVLADSNYENPEDESLIVMVEYAHPQTIITFDGADKSLNMEDDRDIVSDLNRQENEITKDLQISLTEACLIKYFEPHYNKIYKEHFPKPTHEILKEVYDIDFGAISVELNSEFLRSRLYSNKRPAGFHHIANFDLHNPDIRQSIFNILNVDSGSNAEEQSGPLY